MSDRHANLKYKFGNRKFWAEGYYVPAVGPDEAAAAKHMREQGRAYIARDWPGVKGCGGSLREGSAGEVGALPVRPARHGPIRNAA